MRDLEKYINKEETRKAISPKIVYEDENWTIELLYETDFNPQIRISCFKDGHFVEDLKLSRMMMEDDVIDDVKDLIYK